MRAKLFLTTLVLSILLELPSIRAADWVEIPHPAGDYLSTVRYVNGSWFVLGGNGLLLRSSDGLDFSAVPNFSSYSFEDITYGNGLYMIGTSGEPADNARDVPTRYISPDAVHWTAVKSQVTTPTGTFYDNISVLGRVGFGLGQFVAVARVDAADGQGYYRYVFTGTNGTDWNAVTSFGAVDIASTFDIASGNGRIVVVGGKHQLDTTYNTVLASTTDGQSWTFDNSADPADWQDVGIGSNSLTFVTFAGGQFVALGYNRRAISTDGVTWTKSSPMNNVVPLAYSDGTYYGQLTVGANSYVSVSPDGITWWQGAALPASLKALTVVGNVGVGISADTYPPAPNRIFYLSNINSVLRLAGPTTVHAAFLAPFIYAPLVTSPATSFSATGLPAGLSLDPATGIISGTAASLGLVPVTLTATSAAGSSTTTLFFYFDEPAVSLLPASFVNLSARAQVTPTDPLIGGLVIGGAHPETVLLRAVGPTLTSFGLPGAIPNPRLQVYDAKGVLLAENSNWADDPALSGIFGQLGAFALRSGSTDAAALVTLAPGVYSVVVSDVNGASGPALVEVYAASNDPAASPTHLVNLSARATANSGDTTLIGGFVITGTASKRVLIRGAGPSLGPAGVAKPMPDPILALYTQDGDLLAANDNWETPLAVTAAQLPASAGALSAAAAQAGAFPFLSGSKDAAMIVVLPPGLYSAQVKSATGVTGTALVEVYELPTTP